MGGPITGTHRNDTRLPADGTSAKGWRAFIGLGANLGDPQVQVEQALSALAQHEGLALVARSRCYWSRALLLSGQAPQPDYCNAVAEITSQWAPLALLKCLQDLETQAGRQRGERWGARRLDLDLLHVEGVALHTPELNLPHPGVATRSWVLLPLAEVAPNLVIPGLGAVLDLAATVDRHDLLG